MKRVTGIGGIFFKSPDPKRLTAWYRDHLGVEVEDWGGVVFQSGGSVIWNASGHDGDGFAPSTAPFMINYRVDDLDALLKVLREEGCEVLDKVDDSGYGKFGWVIDPDGNKVELWEE